MDGERRVTVIGRRDFVLGAAGAAAFMGWLAAGGVAVAQEKAPQDAEALIKSILKDAKPAEGKVKLDLPEIAENGNTVPYAIEVESPVTATDYVKAVHIISTGNPQPQIATFHFTPLSGKAAASSRMRLGRTQDIVAIAEMSDGRFFMGKRTVKVTIGGCGG
ncbi:MAG: thiosulfate oxidation carrier protein SoxY [Hyphomicrobiaceae bacterium]